MILELVDRQWDASRAEISAAMWAQLQKAVAAIGQSDWPVDVVLVTDESMAELNGSFRGKKAVTDILSFSYLQSEGAEAATCEAGQNFAPHHLWVVAEAGQDGPWPTVGELVLAPKFIEARCQTNDWPWATEIPMLIVHGCLHLLGWDHEEAEELAVMQSLESEILAQVGLTHPLRPRS